MINAGDQRNAGDSIFIRLNVEKELTLEGAAHATKLRNYPRHCQGETYISTAAHCHMLADSISEIMR